MKIVTKSEEETLAVARKLATHLQAGDILCLSGDLGAGKTTFTRGMVAGLLSPVAVSSPTFTLIHEYSGGRLPVYHVDAYRLGSAEDALTTGLEEYLLREDGVLVIEWPEKLAAVLPADRLSITLVEEGDGRRIVLTPTGERAQVVTLALEEETAC